MSETTLRVNGEIDQPPEPPTKHSKHTGLLDSESVALYIGPTESPVIVKINPEATFGRMMPNSPSQPTVDLIPFGAFQLGVSRIHAVIHPSGQNSLVIEDLGSSNGTTVNELRLAPRTPHPLASGDVIKMGQLRMQIYFENIAVTVSAVVPASIAQTNGAPQVQNQTASAPVPTPSTLPRPSQLAPATVGQEEEEDTHMLGETPIEGQPTTFHGTVLVNPQRAFSELGLITDEIIRHLNSLEGCEVKLTLEISARKTNGFSDMTTDVITDRSRVLKFIRSQFKRE